MAFLTLNAGDEISLGSGTHTIDGTGKVTFTSTSAQATYAGASGAADTVAVVGASTDYNASKDGSNLVLTHKTTGKTITIASGPTADTVTFSNGSLTLQYVTGTGIKLGTQVVSNVTPAAISDTPTGAGTSTGSTTGQTFMLTASVAGAAATNVNEGTAATFTVTASKAVTVDTEVTLQLVQGTATLADFNAGAFTPAKVIIKAGELTSAPYSITTITNDGTELSETYSVTASVGGSVVGTANMTVIDGAVGAGQTFTLTKELDIIPGMKGSNDNTVTSGNDTVIGVIDVTASSTATTFAATDMINTGEGVDTFKVSIAGDFNKAGAQSKSVPTSFEGVEVLEVMSSVTNTDGGAGTSTVKADAAALTSLTDINVTKSSSAIEVLASASTNVTVNMKASANDTDIEGGKNISVTLTDVAANTNTVDIGGTTAAKGTVTVSATGKAVTDNGDFTLGAIDVKGGTTVSVTQKATSSDAAVTSVTTGTATGTTVTQGKVTVLGDSSTTTVTVKQDATVGETLARAAVTGKATTQDITFTDAKAGDHVTLTFTGGNTLQFTAKKDLTAAQVASAFANLANGNLQGKASATLGIYTDAGNGVQGGWSSGAVTNVTATSSKVTFSNASAAAASITAAAVQVGAGSTFAVTAPAAVAGTDAETVRAGVLGVTAGQVDIEDSGAGFIKTITIDGYATGSDIGTNTAGTAALETLNLANAGAGVTLVVDDTAANLTLTVEKLGVASSNNDQEAVLNFTDAPLTLNVKSVGNNYIDLTANATKTLNVSGSGLLDIADVDLIALETVKVTETAGLTLNAGVDNTITSVDTSGTTGTVTVSIQGDKATYTGGAGMDVVSVTNPATAISKAINLGGGNDTLTMSAATPAIPTVTLEGGEGTDTIALTAADAISLSGSTSFEGKINSFEKLSVTKATTAGTIDLANLDDISYVISANSNSAATTELHAITFKALAIGQSVTVDGLTLKADTTALTDTAVAGAFDSLAALSNGSVAPAGGAFTGALSANWSSGAAAGAVVTYTSATASADVTDIVTSVNVASAAPTALGSTDSADVTEQAAVTFVAAANAETVTVAGRTLTVTDGGGMSAAEIEAAFATGASGKGTFDTALVGWSVAGTNGNNGDGILSFTSTTADQFVTDIVVSDTAGAGNLAAATTQGYASTTVTFQDLIEGQSVTVEGLTLTATEAITATEIAEIFDDLAASTTAAGISAVAKAVLTGALSDEFASQANAAGAVEFRSVKAAITETDFTATTAAMVAGTALGLAPTQGVAAGGTLTLDKMANNGTVELTGAGGGVIVKITDATTGTTDLLNVVTNATNGTDLGSVTATKVETISIEAKDTDTSTTVSTNTLALITDSAKTVNVKGDGNLSLTLHSSTKEVTLVDASTMTGALTLTTLNGDTAATTVKGGSGADTLTARGSNDVLQGGLGNDTLAVGNGATYAVLTGGDGTDKFDVTSFNAGAGGAVTITDLAKGETIKFVSNAAADFNSSKVTLISSSTFTEYVAEAAKVASANSANTHGISWFQFTDNLGATNTFIVQNIAADNAFTEGTDIIVQLTGVVDLSASSFNDVGEGTLLYI